MKKLIKETVFYKKFTSRIYDEGESLHNQEVEEKEVDAIEIPNGATNGDMIKAMFPNIEIEGIGGEIKCIAAQNGTSYFALDWWNAPYKGGRE